MSPPAMSTAESPTEEGNDDLLRAQLTVEPSVEAGCSVVADGRDGQAVTHQMKVDPVQLSDCSQDECDSLYEGGECHTEVAFEEGEDESLEYVTSAITGKCICPVFAVHNCAPKVIGVTERSITIRFSTRDRDEIRSVIDHLRAVDATVSVEWLVMGKDADSTAEINVDDITTKQQEALETARELGYYETPRQTDLTEIANQLDISESAVSQRLNGAETKLVRAFLE